MTSPNPSPGTPDYRHLAETNADEAAFRLANGAASPGGDPAAVMALALTSLAGIGIAANAELRELRLTMEAGVDVLRQLAHSLDPYAAHRPRHVTGLAPDAAGQVRQTFDNPLRTAADRNAADEALDRLEARLGRRCSCGEAQLVGVQRLEQSGTVHRLENPCYVGGTAVPAQEVRCSCGDHRLTPGSAVLVVGGESHRLHFPCLVDGAGA